MQKGVVQPECWMRGLLASCVVTDVQLTSQQHVVSLFSLNHTWRDWNTLITEPHFQTTG